MIATPNKQTSKEKTESHEQESTAIVNVKTLPPHSLLILPNRHITHHPKAGLNPLADAAAYLFSILGKVKYLKFYRPLVTLQKELIQEMDSFQEHAKNLGYNPEYIIVSRYILCSAFDDIISHTPWGGNGQWEAHSLLASYNQDSAHQKKFFTIMERTIKEPRLYIDLMEVMYLCLSMGYKGQYRATEHSQFQLEQVTSNLYKYIRNYRGNISKVLSPFSLRASKPEKALIKREASPLFIFFVTACIIMIIFISLGYLMDVISNEAYKDLFSMESSVPKETMP